MTSSQHAPYALGYTHTTMPGCKRLQTREGELIREDPGSVQIAGCNSPA